MKIVIAGSSGRMGRTLIEAVLKDGEMQLAAALEQADSPFLGKDAGELVGSPCGVAIAADADAALAGADCLIDFTRPAGTLAHMAACCRRGVAMVIGTTGMEMEHKLQIQDASREIPIVFAPNMAVGVNLVFRLIDTAARVLAQERLTTDGLTGLLGGSKTTGDPWGSFTQPSPELSWVMQFLIRAGLASNTPLRQIAQPKPLRRAYLPGPEQSRLFDL